MATIQGLLDEFRKLANSPREQGDLFEHLILLYLKNDPQYQSRFSDVWLWKDWPDRGTKPDTGIDLVAKLHNNAGYCAVQCKFYDRDHTLQKADIDSFFTESGKEPFTERLIVSTTDLWSKHAEDSLVGQQIPVTRLRFQDLEQSPFDWSSFRLRRPDTLRRLEKKTLRPHQEDALAKAIEGFETADRGKLIMACGTGKTFTALKIAERLVPQGGLALFLVPSLSLLSQTLREWTAESQRPIRALAVCSDSGVGRSKKSDDTEDITTHDLAIPPTTDADRLLRALVPHSAPLRKGKQNPLPIPSAASEPSSLPPDTLTVIFSTYQSIEVISQAQKGGMSAFDLVICDEAHRTTGTILKEEGASHFLKVHDNSFLQSKKRLYMTATPKVFGDSARTKAQDEDVVLCSMDDPEMFGEEFYRLGFAEAIERGLLSDYKVMVLAVDERFINRAFQTQIADGNNEITLDDAVKITGCWNGLSKRFMESDPSDHSVDPTPMRRAVAFAQKIDDSKKITKLFNDVIEVFRSSASSDASFLPCEIEHVDGTQNALYRSQRLEWLKEDVPPAESGGLPPCRILSNVRCLSEGVDVPALDAVLFLHPRKSQVDIVQSVGRIMRKAQGKKYGYILLPVGIPVDLDPEEALNDHDKYKVVWQVLQALRSHDDRFDIMINQLALNKQRPDRIQVIGISGPPSDKDSDIEPSTNAHEQFSFQFAHLDGWKDAIFGRIVKKCGERPYWERWAKDVADIAQRHSERIHLLLKSSDKKPREAFDAFLASLHTNINESVTPDDAIEMLSQHLVTKPIFDALFGNDDFAKNNPVSTSMQGVLEILEGQAIHKETASLDKFYKSVQRKIQGIDNAEGKQKIIVELYDTFFKAAFPRMAERLGIVYTPVEVVDFILQSANVILQRSFGKTLSDKDIHIIDPFVGTGTFITRLLQSDLLRPADLLRKYKQELHANEIVLLAYYIASVNIESTFHSIRKASYQPFPGIVLTDTFQTSEKDGSLLDKLFPENNKRIRNQKNTPIRVILGNPPYSVGQASENDANKNLKYPRLDGRIRDTYAAESKSANKNSLYDSYIRAIRWAADRLADQEPLPKGVSKRRGRGLIAFVTNGSFIDNNAMSGLRKCLQDEFSSIYCFNLRGNQRTSGETSRREGGKIFGSGSRTPVAITFLVKNPEDQGPCDLWYYDIGDYLSREEKLQKLRVLRSIDGIEEWEEIVPNDSHDWINQRSPEFDAFLPLGSKDSEENNTIFSVYSSGLQTNRDAWCYNFSFGALGTNVERMIDFYNEQLLSFMEAPLQKKKKIDAFISNDPTKIKWSSSLKETFERGHTISFDGSLRRKSTYRPYCKEWLYFQKALNHRTYQMPKLFPNADTENVVICTTGAGATKEYSALASSILPDLEVISKSQCFPLYFYERTDAKQDKSEPIEQRSLFTQDASDAQATYGEDVAGGYRRKDAVTDWALKTFQAAYGKKAKIAKEDIFYYVYGVLHSPTYRTKFASDLKKRLARIPLLTDFWAYSKAGRALAALHLGYETIEPYPLTEVQTQLKLSEPNYRVEKMAFGKKGGAVDKTVIVYNSTLQLTGIPMEAYDYIVNGKSALDWVMERYQVTVDKDSGIRNDPNEWSDDPRYIVDLVKRVVAVSLGTLEVVNGLPAWKLLKR